MRKKPARFILLSTLLVGSSCRPDHGVSPTLDNEAESRFYSVSLVPVDPSLYEVIISVAEKTEEEITFFLNEVGDTLIFKRGDSAIGYSGRVEIKEGNEFITTEVGATFYTSASSPTLTVTFDDPFSTEQENPFTVTYTFPELTDPVLQGGATWVKGLTSGVWGDLTKGRLGKVNVGEP